MSSISYAQAATELDSILRDLESGNLDVDLLAAKVRRASELIEICRSKVQSARAEIHSITQPS